MEIYEKQLLTYYIIKPCTAGIVTHFIETLKNLYFSFS